MQDISILIVDDEKPIRDMLRMALELASFTCLEAENAQQAYVMAIDHSPQLILLDWMLPGGSGIEVLRRLKRDDATVEIPVIMLTAKTEEDNKVQGLDVGADDYITKPFAPKELIARIRAVLRRAGTIVEDTVLEADALKLDIASHRVFIGEQPIDMGPTEFKLLTFFMSHRDRVYTRGQLLDHVWGGNVYVEERTVDVHIRRLRKALQALLPCGRDYGKLIQTVRGTGYRFSVTMVDE
jgi:two-component system phosphate regulon response regulator PhoB